MIPAPSCSISRAIIYLKTVREERVRDRKKGDGKKDGWGDWSQILYEGVTRKYSDSIQKIIYIYGTVLFNNGRHAWRLMM
jgi:hypothetical protein